MKVKEAVVWLKRYQGYEPFENGIVLKHSFDLTDETVDAILSAISGANIGEPLTPEQLREMDGQPAWIVPVGEEDWDPHWGVMRHTRFSADSKTVRGKMYFLYLDSYGVRWLSYASPLAHIDRKAWDDCRVCGKYKAISFKGFRTKEEAIDLSGNVHPHITGGAMFCPKCGKPRNERAWADLEQRLRG